MISDDISMSDLTGSFDTTFCRPLPLHRGHFPRRRHDHIELPKGRRGAPRRRSDLFSAAETGTGALVTRRARATAAIGLLEGLRWKAATRNSHLCDGNCQCNCQCNCGILAWLGLCLHSSWEFSSSISKTSAELIVHSC